MKIEYKEGLIVLKDQDEEVGYIKYVRKEENVIDVISTVVHEKYQGQGMAGKLFDWRGDQLHRRGFDVFHSAKQKAGA